MNFFLFVFLSVERLTRKIKKLNLNCLFVVFWPNKLRDYPAFSLTSQFEAFVIHDIFMNTIFQWPSKVSS
jgi:hypothetical protein